MKPEDALEPPGARRRRARPRRLRRRPAGLRDRADRPRLAPSSCSSGRSSSPTRPRALDAARSARRSRGSSALLLRGLRQYFTSSTSQQTRFNLHVARPGRRARGPAVERAGSASCDGPRVIVHQVLSGAGPVDAVTTQALRVPGAASRRGAGAATTSRAHRPAHRRAGRAAARARRRRRTTTLLHPLLGLRAAAARACSSCPSARCCSPTTSRRRGGSGTTSRRSRSSARSAASSCPSSPPRCDVVAGVSAYNAARARAPTASSRSSSTRRTSARPRRAGPGRPADAAVRRAPRAAQAPGRAHPPASRSCAATACPTRGCASSASR